MAEQITEQAPFVAGPQASEVVTPSAPATATDSILDLYVNAEDDHDEAPTSVAPGKPVVVPAPQPVPAAPAPLAHPRHLLHMAADFGIPQAEAEAMSSDQLGQTVYHLNRQVLALHRDLARDQVQQQARETPPPSPGPGTEGRAVTPAGTPAAEEEISLGPNEADFAPELVTMLKGIVREVRTKVSALEKELTGYRQKDQAREQETTFDRVDRSFTRHEAVLGKGGRADVRVGSPEYAKRMAVLSLVDRDASNSPLEAKIDRAVNLLYGAGGADSTPATPQPVAPAPSPVRPARPQRPDGTFMSDAEIAAVARWNGGAAARPSQRSGAPEPNGVVKATQSVSEQLRGMLSDSPEGADDLDQFPE